MRLIQGSVVWPARRQKCMPMRREPYTDAAKDTHSV